MNILFIKKARSLFEAYKTALSRSDPSAEGALMALESHLWSVELPPDDRYALSQTGEGQWRIMVYDNGMWIDHSNEVFVTVTDAAAAIPGAGKDTAEWVQPAGAHDAYQMGAQVKHNGFVWVSAVNANVWEPGVYGWVKQ